MKSDNLIVIEIKKIDSSSSDRDKSRLEYLTTSNNNIGIIYKLGVFVLVGKEEIELTFFENGKEIQKERFNEINYFSKNIKITNIE